MSRADARRSLAAALLVALVAAAVVVAALVGLPTVQAGQATRPAAAAPTAAPAVRPVVRNVLACPQVPAPVAAVPESSARESRSGGSPVPAEVLALAAPVHSPAAGTDVTPDLGVLELQAAGDGGVRTFASVRAPARLTAAQLPDAVVLTDARDELAAGAAASVVTGSGSSRDVLACQPATAEAAFVGVATTVGERPVLLLTNPSDGAAVAQVQLFSPTGPVAMAGGGVVAVAPGATKQLALDAAAADVTDLGVRVVARQGRVAAALRVTRSSGLTDLPPVWLSGAPVSRTHLVQLPTLPPEANAVVTLLAPGTTDAVAALSVTAADGTTTALPPVTVAAGTTHDVRLSAPSGPAVLRVRADVPLVAAVRVTSPAPGEGSNVAVLAPAATSRAAVVGAAGCLRGQTCRLVVSADTAAARVRVGLVTRDGIASEQTLQLAAGATEEVGLQLPEGTDAAGVILTSLDGAPVAASAALLTDGVLRAVPLRAVVPAIPVPVVTADVRTGQEVGTAAGRSR